MSMNTGIKDYVVPVILLVTVLIALQFGLPLLSGMSGISSNMSTAISNFGDTVSSGFPFIVVIIIIGVAVQIKK